MTYSLSVQLDAPVSPSVFVTELHEMSEHSYCEDEGNPAHLSPNDVADKSADHNYCTFSSDSQPLVASLREQLHSLADHLSSQPQSCTERLETILLLLKCIDQQVNGDLKEKDTAETVLALLKAEDWTKDVYSSYLLTCIGSWLGQQFHAANSSISQKVEGFKVQHIERISDLPPAEELTAELFPEAMQMLLLHWMGLCEESSQEKRRNENPILLLILEFANHNLITGVAHVLYSSLICK